MPSLRFQTKYQVIIILNLFTNKYPLPWLTVRVLLTLPTTGQTGQDLQNRIHWQNTWTCRCNHTQLHLNEMLLYFGSLSFAEAQRGFSYGETPLKSEYRRKSRYADLSALAPALTLPSEPPLTRTSTEERDFGSYSAVWNRM